MLTIPGSRGLNLDSLNIGYPSLKLLLLAFIKCRHLLIVLDLFLPLLG
jgi:hypothetical protein